MYKYCKKSGDLIILLLLFELVYGNLFCFKMSFQQVNYTVILFSCNVAR